MKRIKILIIFFGVIVQLNLSAQKKLISGPRADHIELRTAVIWLEVAPSVKNIAVLYREKGKGSSKTIGYKGELGKDFNPVKIPLNGLKINTAYAYSIILDGKLVSSAYPQQFATKDLWQYRKPAPDFTFLAGSCAYFNEPEFDRPGTPYGSDTSIFETMANTNASFNLWLGDNWYTREVDYSSVWGMQYRASHDMRFSILQKLFSKMPQYAIWDDHDFGPNDEGKSFILKDESRKIFMNYWNNPSYGEDGKGIYTKISYSDVDIFLTDDRYFRSEDKIADSVNGKPNIEKTYFGKQQMEWLKNAITYSSATFKIIAVGSQVLNPYSEYECMRYYSAEYYELLNFLETQKIPGILFFSGDRHHSEVIKLDRKDIYPLYDVTVSPLTSGVSKVRGAELNNPARMSGTLVEAQNFGKINVSGNKNERVLSIEFIGLKGNKLGGWQVNENELKKMSKK